MNTSIWPFNDAALALRILESSPAAVVVLDRRGTVLFANDQLTHLLGYEKHEVVGQPSTMFLPDTSACDDEAHRARLLAHAGSGKLDKESIIRVLHKKGVGVLVTLSRYEITEAKEPLVVAHLARVDARLLDQERLETERLAAIAQMVSGLAHESRNALQRAVACLDLLELDLKNNPELMILSNRIRSSLADLLENYDEVRRYAEPIVITPQRVKLLQLCRAVFNELTLRNDGLEEKNEDDASRDFLHQLDFSLTQHDADIAYVDRDKIKLVFKHLLENAIDAAPHIAHIQVICESTQLGSKEALKVTTRDHGSGFAADSLGRAFEPFYTTKQHGTGLGLAICRRIVNAHDGKIHAKNHADGGASIEFIVPIQAKQRSSWYDDGPFAMQFPPPRQKPVDEWPF